ncbi:hypothetical protein V8G54_029118 [Vigna mungo]|uniref:Uncharacterized protein n=1 Tax=Vigna mungo TaxID=3915 RepID=A0AAQ3MTI4_VIGMU
MAASPQDELTKVNVKLTKLNFKLEQLLLFHVNLSNTLHDIANCTTAIEFQPPPTLHTPHPDHSNLTSPPLMAPMLLAGFSKSINRLIIIRPLLTSASRFLPSILKAKLLHASSGCSTTGCCHLRTPTSAHWNCDSLLPSSMTPLLHSPNLRCEVTTLQPPNLPHVIALAKLHDDKFRSSPLLFNRFGLPPPFSPPPPNTPSPTKPFPPLLPTPTTKLPIKKLTEAEMQSRREKNICFNCDERYIRGHCCKQQFLLLTTFNTEDGDENASTKDIPNSEGVPQVTGLINLHEFSGQWSPRTFWVTGSIQGYAAQILIDSGATHNFIQNKVAQFLRLPTQPTPSPLSVMVGNGTFLPCSSLCPNITLTLDSRDFSINLYTLDLSGIHVVLSVHWLSMISPFVMNYNGPFMRFT